MNINNTSGGLLLYFIMSKMRISILHFSGTNLQFCYRNIALIVQFRGSDISHNQSMKGRKLKKMRIPRPCTMDELIIYEKIRKLDLEEKEKNHATTFCESQLLFLLESLDELSATK